MMKDHGTSSDCHFYKLQYLPSKGYGVVATRDIQPSELIVRELPILKVQLTADGDICGKFDLNRQEFVSPTLILALNQLADNDLFKFYNLADSCSSKIAEENGINSEKFKGKLLFKCLAKAKFRFSEKATKIWS